MRGLALAALLLAGCGTFEPVPAVGVLYDPGASTGGDRSRDIDFESRAMLGAMWIPKRFTPPEASRPSKLWDDPTTPWSEPAQRLGIDDPETEWDEGAQGGFSLEMDYLPAPPKNARDYESWLMYAAVLVALAGAGYLVKKMRSGQGEKPGKEA